MKDLEESLGVQGAVAQVNTALLETEQRCEAFKAHFNKYEFLWRKDMNQALQVNDSWQAERRTWLMWIRNGNFAHGSPCLPFVSTVGERS
jgi:hypothetical protein